MATRYESNETILNACRAITPDIIWGFTLKGARKSNCVEGTVSCDEITFENISKDKQHAKAEYKITIIEMDGDADIDAMADLIFKCFNGTNMGGLAYSVNVTRILYGAVLNAPTSKAVQLYLDVEYPVDK